MPVVNRRLQVLLDEERYRCLEHIARQRRTSVPALVRDALDRAYHLGPSNPQTAAGQFLDLPPLDLGDWADARQEIEASYEGR